MLTYEEIILLKREGRCSKSVGNTKNGFQLKHVHKMRTVQPQVRSFCMSHSSLGMHVIAPRDANQTQPKENKKRYHEQIEYDDFGFRKLIISNYWTFRANNKH